MELLKLNRLRMITVILQDYYLGVLEEATSHPDSFNEYAHMADSDPSKLAAAFTNDLRLILERKPTHEICSMYADLANNQVPG